MIDLEAEARRLCPYYKTADRHGTATKCHEEILAALTKVREGENLDWRALLCFTHGHHPYGDDGEMQCVGCDFKRANRSEIYKHVWMAARAEGERAGWKRGMEEAAEIADDAAEIEPKEEQGESEGCRRTAFAIRSRIAAAEKEE